MENEKSQEKQEIAIVPSGEATAELIPQLTAELIEKSFAENTIRNRRHADDRSQTGCSPNISQTCSMTAKHLGQSLSLFPQ